jgi:hypothetical protein
MRGPNCGRHVWFGHEGGFAPGDQKLYQERNKTAPHVASVGDGTETEMTQASVETLVPGSSCWSGKTCVIGPSLEEGRRVEEDMV